MPAREDVIELILRRARLRTQRRVLWLAYLAASATPSAAGAAIDPLLLRCLDARDTSAAEAAWSANDPEALELASAIAAVEADLEGPAGARLRRLAELFRLDRFERDVLEACVAALVDPALASAFAFVQRHPSRTYVSAPLVARVYGHGDGVAWWAASPLALWGLVVAGHAPPGEAPPLDADAQLVTWLRGELSVEAGLAGALREIQPRVPFAGWPVEDTLAWLRRVGGAGRAVRVVVVGASGSGRRSFAAAVARRLDVRAIGVDTGAVATADWPLLAMRACRLALVSKGAPVWHGAAVERAWPAGLPVLPLSFVCCEADDEPPAHPQLVDHRVLLPEPSQDERRALWIEHVPGATGWSRPALDELVARFRIGPGDIAAAARRVPQTPAEAHAACRQHLRHGLGELGQLLDCPFTHDDLVVPDAVRETLADFVFEARERASFWQGAPARRLFPRGTALVGLLSGPPGTGKTMAAQVVAAQLGLDLYRIDLAQTVSKYIGETAKNLRRVFTRAARMDAVLLFDEADALFSRRTDVRDSLDRHANADTGYLLQLLEDYRGVALLSTNRRQDIDPAFVRRMRYVLELPAPDAEMRARLWQRLLGELCGDGEAERLRGAWDPLAAQLDTSGAQIKNAIVAALFAARRRAEPLAAAHLVKGVERELAKDGRSLGRRERERLVSDA